MTQLSLGCQERSEREKNVSGICWFADGLQVTTFTAFGQIYVSTKSLKLAERVGFEPTVRLPVQRFSRPSHSTTLAPLRARSFKQSTSRWASTNRKLPPELPPRVEVRSTHANFSGSCREIARGWMT